MTDTLTIHDAILAVMAKVTEVKKLFSDKLNYSYVGELALIEALRPAMIEHGIHIYVSGILDRHRERYETKNKTVMVNTLLTGLVTFTHAPSKTSITVYATGEGADTGDKASNKAMTSMLKYALKQTFLLPSLDESEDPDSTSSSSQERVVPVTDEEKKKDAIQRYNQLVHKANEAGTVLRPMPENLNLSQISEFYKEQLNFYKSKQETN